MPVGGLEVVLYAAAIAAAVAILTPVIMVSLRLCWLSVQVVPGVGAEPTGDALKAHAPATPQPPPPAAAGGRS
jgi:hypothetical protein